uniref:Phospholipase A(2) n=1 Tax=Steinernema glaseri TaxID=37863 RepID=A0A1I7YQA0_9BILA
MLVGYFFLVLVALASAAIKDPNMGLEEMSEATHRRGYPVESFISKDAIADLIPTKIKQDIKKFSCGTEIFSTLAAWIAVTSTCHKDKHEMINACCRAHDACYENQEGQLTCDEIFCACLRNAQSKREEEKKCSLIVDGMCSAVIILGEKPYKNSVGLKSG